MSASQRRFFSGNSLDQAVMRAARHHGLDPAQVAFRLVEKRHGFLRIRRRVVIEVDPVQPRWTAGHRAAVVAAPAGSGEAPARPVPPPRLEREQAERPRERRAEAASEEAAAGPRARPQALRELFPPAAGAVGLAAEKALDLALALAGLRVERAVLQGDGRLEIDLWGSDAGRLIAADGELIAALQHLLPRLIRGFIGETIPCRVDSEGFHEIREERLRELAQRLAAAVRREGRSRTLDPLPPDERRIVHLSLADDPGVVTRSLGEGYLKRIIIQPARDESRGGA